MNTSDNIGKNQNNRIELALASLMFFAPFVKKILKSRNDISDADKTFVLGFIKLGYLNILLLVLAIITQIFYYTSGLSILNICSSIIIVILAVLLGVGSFLVITGKEIIKCNTDESHKATNDNIVSKIILAYIPLYNVYLWYEMHDFDGRNTYLKESLILWGIFSVLLLAISNKYVLIGYMIIILISMLLNIFQVTFGQSSEQFINNLFKKNPEEIRGGFIGILIAPFVSQSVRDSIDSEKGKYSLIFKLDHKQILLELIIIIGLSVFGIYMGIKVLNFTLITGIVLILARYLIMLIKWKHLPHIPVIREITSIFFISKKV